MTYQPTDFKTALDLDMAMKGINERVLGERIGVSQQAISKWRARGFPPAYRWEQLRTLLGPESYTAQLQFPTLVSAGHRLRVAPPSNVPQVPESEQGNRLEAHTRSMGDVHNADASWLRVLSLLPEAVRPVAPRATLRAGRVSAAVDYAGPNLVLDFVASARANVSQPLLKLAALKAADPSMRTVLCLLSPMGADFARQRIGYGEMLGVETWIAVSEEDAAAQITRAALETCEPPDQPE